MELDDDDLDCESPSSVHEPPRLHQSVDSCRPRKPAIALPPPPPRSAPPIGGAPSHSICGGGPPSCTGTPPAINGVTSGCTITSPASLRTVPVRSTTSSGALPNGLMRQANAIDDPASVLRPADLELKRNNAALNGNESPAGEMRLQQSLSTPCPGGSMEPSTSRKDSEYRRFKSEGSAAGACSLPAPEMDVTIDDLSPIADPRSSPPGRLNLFQDTVTTGPLTKHSHTEQVMMMHTLKTKLSKYQNFIDKAFQHIAQGSDEQIIEGCTIVAKVMTKAWMFPKISHDLSYALCDYLRDQNYLDALIMHFIKAQTCEPVRLACGRVLEECLSLNNREYVVNKGYLKKLVATAMKLSKNPEQQRMSLSIMESLFKHSTATSYRYG
ncbi:unnamed protein product [Toxocara canis]|uniref:Uncharacterized protein n=1 Tax=Toxocara canis TaxID=6265 RepID=A0A3P7GRQ7_TOXCA|nr:unnamed protein product [Toxocara canis]